MTWRRRQPITFWPTSDSAPLDSRFPRAIPGEDYERYARAMWPQSQRWIRKHRHRIANVAKADLPVHEIQDVLRRLATIDLGRRLYGQEERLITELVQAAWHDLGGTSATPSPEIPSFLVARR
ncbi:MAG TPA: hypothetical protein VN706_09425 [Gemmatimonadaceae bacterium]|nr:hypothetical protein [Gemmatimonadaceae bacterium]